MEEIGHFEVSFLKRLDKKYLEGLRGRLTSEFKDEPFARRHAIMNLLGFVHCELGDVADGIELFQTINQEDKTNLNALLNMAWANDKLGLKREPDECSQTVCDLKGDEATEKIVKARALLEIARAACFTDQHHKQADIKYAKKIFSHALDLGKANHDKEEVMDWKFGLAYHLLRLTKKARNDKVDDERFFKEGVEVFYEIAVYTEAIVKNRQLGRQESIEFVREAEIVHDREVVLEQRIKDMRGKAWAFLGVLLNWYRNRYSNISGVLQGCLPQHTGFDGYRCLKEALDIAPSCPAVLRRVAQEYYEAGKLTEALEEAKKAVKLQGIGFAYYVLGQIYLKLYTSETNSEKRDEILLQHALTNFKEAINKNFKPSYAVRDYADANFLKKNYVRALENFSKAEAATGGKKDHRLYDCWAKCLDEMGNHKGASQKRETADRIKTALFDGKFDFGALYSGKDGDDVTQIVKAIEEKFRVKGYTFQRNCLPGVNIDKEFKQLCDTCHIFFLFISANFTDSDKCLGEMTYVCDKISKDGHIIPVLLNDACAGELPSRLRHRHALSYGQEHFWSKLKEIFNP